MHAMMANRSDLSLIIGLEENAERTEVEEVTGATEAWLKGETAVLVLPPGFALVGVVQKPAAQDVCHSAHGDMTDEFRVGDRVRCHSPGSWVDGKEGTVAALDVLSSDDIRGHQIQMPNGYTVVEPSCLARIVLPDGSDGIVAPYVRPLTSTVPPRR